jgi:hypothetical protein
VNLPSCALTCGRAIEPGRAIGSYRLCQPCHDLAWAIAADAGIARSASHSLPLPPRGVPTLSMPKTSAPTKACACGGTITRKSGRGPWPRKCDDCKAASLAEPGEETDPAPEESGKAAIDVLATIGALQLDYLVGSAFRYIAEYRDGDELANLRAAREYLNEAITARER